MDYIIKVSYHSANEQMWRALTQLHPPRDVHLL
jgi:hypothetical protein